MIIKCFTYNQAPYIAYALEGFVKQETNFPFCAVVVDDFSTDGTAKVIRNYEAKYPDIIKGIYLTENYKSQHKSKEGIMQPWYDEAEYIAMCEGDDYWTDSLKLQKQVEFMDEHPDYGLCHTDFIKYNQQLGEHIYVEREIVNGEVTEDLINGNFFIAALTTLYRKSVFERADKTFRGQGFLMGDLPLWIELSRLSKVHYIPEITSTYRELPNSAAHSTSRLKKAKFQQNLYEVRKYFIDKYGYEKLRKTNEQDLYYHNSIVFALERKPIAAISSFIKGHHFNLKEIKHFITRFIVKP